MQLLNKYDPEKKPPPLLALKNQGKSISNPKIDSDNKQSSNKTVMGKAGNIFFPIVDKLANTVIGDDPKLLEEIR